MAAVNYWTEEQITVVLYEYCRKPFGQFSASKDFVQQLGKLIGRSADAVVRKVGNLASFDPKMKQRGVVGLAHTSKLDGIVWEKYYGNWEQLTFDAEILLAKFRNRKLEESLEIDLNNLPKGAERLQEIKRRINQNFFRQTVLASYNLRCCITGINNPTLLQASHIVDWSKDEKNRTNPENGLCLNPLFHKAYDENLLGITPDYEIIVSDEFFGKKVSDVDDKVKEYVTDLNGRKIILPRRFSPDRDLLAQHFENFRHHVA